MPVHLAAYPRAAASVYPWPMSTTHIPTGTDTDLLTIRDLMRYSGESESAWRKRLGRRELPYIRLGANVRVRRRDLDQWLTERTIPAAGVMRAPHE